MTVLWTNGLNLFLTLTFLSQPSITYEVFGFIIDVLSPSFLSFDLSSFLFSPSLLTYSFPSLLSVREYPCTSGWLKPLGIYRLWCCLLVLFPFSSTCHIWNDMFNVCLLIWTLRSLRAETCSALFTAVSSHPGQCSVHSCSMTIYQKTWTLSGLCIPLRCLVCLMCLIWLLLLPTLPARYSHKVTGDIHRVNFSLFQCLQDHSITSVLRTRALQSKWGILLDVRWAKPFMGWQLIREQETCTWVGE